MMISESDFRERLRRDAARTEDDLSESRHDAIMAALRRAQRNVPERKTVFFEKFSAWGKAVSVSAALLLAVCAGVLGLWRFRPEPENPEGNISAVINTVEEDIFSEMFIRPDTVLSVISFPVSFREDSGEGEGKLRKMIPCSETLRVLAKISGINDERSRESSPRQSFLENSEYREFLVTASEFVRESFVWILEPEVGGDEF